MPARITAEEVGRLVEQVESKRALSRWLMAAPEAADLPDIASLLRRPAWMAQGACRGVGVDLFVQPPDRAALRPPRPSAGAARW